MTDFFSLKAIPAPGSSAEPSKIHTPKATPRDNQPKEATFAKALQRAAAPKAQDPSAAPSKSPDRALAPDSSQEPKTLAKPGPDQPQGSLQTRNKTQNAGEDQDHQQRTRDLEPPELFFTGLPVATAANANLANPLQSDPQTTRPLGAQTALTTGALSQESRSPTLWQPEPTSANELVDVLSDGFSFDGSLVPKQQLAVTTDGAHPNPLMQQQSSPSKALQQQPVLSQQMASLLGADDTLSMTATNPQTQTQTKIQTQTDPDLAQKIGASGATVGTALPIAAQTPVDAHQDFMRLMNEPHSKAAIPASEQSGFLSLSRNNPAFQQVRSLDSKLWNDSGTRPQFLIDSAPTGSPGIIEKIHFGSGAAAGSLAGITFDRPLFVESLTNATITQIPEGQILNNTKEATLTALQAHPSQDPQFSTANPSPVAGTLGFAAPMTPLQIAIQQPHAAAQSRNMSLNQNTQIAPGTLTTQSNQNILAAGLIQSSDLAVEEEQWIADESIVTLDPFSRMGLETGTTGSSGFATERSLTAPPLEQGRSTEFASNLHSRVMDATGQMMLAGGTGQARMTLRDSQLGSLDVFVQVSGDRKVSVDLRADSSDLQKQIQGQLDDLREGLQSQNFESVDVRLVTETQNSSSFDLSGGKGQREQANQGNTNGNSSSSSANQENSMNQGSGGNLSDRQHSNSSAGQHQDPQSKRTASQQFGSTNGNQSESTQMRSAYGEGSRGGINLKGNLNFLA